MPEGRCQSAFKAPQWRYQSQKQKGKAIVTSVCVCGGVLVCVFTAVRDRLHVPDSQIGFSLFFLSECESLLASLLSCTGIICICSFSPFAN